MLKCYWVSCSFCTVQVNVRDDIIEDTAPIVSRFIGQKFSNLIGWCTDKFGPTEIELLRIKP